MQVTPVSRNCCVELLSHYREYNAGGLKRYPGGNRGNSVP